MEIYLPYVKPSYPWWRKLAMRLCNWMLWYLPAWCDATAIDVGIEYQLQVTLFAALGIALPLTSALFFPTLIQLAGMPQYDWWAPNALAALALYLLVGALYNLTEKYGHY